MPSRRGRGSPVFSGPRRSEEYSKVRDNSYPSHRGRAGFRGNRGSRGYSNNRDYKNTYYQQSDEQDKSTDNIPVKVEREFPEKEVDVKVEEIKDMRPSLQQAHPHSSSSSVTSDRVSPPKAYSRARSTAHKAKDGELESLSGELQNLDICSKKDENVKQERAANSQKNLRNTQGISTIL